MNEKNGRYTASPRWVTSALLVKSFLIKKKKKRKEKISLYRTTIRLLITLRKELEGKRFVRIYS